MLHCVSTLMSCNSNSGSISTVVNVLAEVNGFVGWIIVVCQLSSYCSNPYIANSMVLEH